MVRFSVRSYLGLRSAAKQTAVDGDAGSRVELLACLTTKSRAAGANKLEPRVPSNLFAGSHSRGNWIRDKHLASASENDSFSARDQGRANVNILPRRKSNGTEREKKLTEPHREPSPTFHSPLCKQTNKQTKPLTHVPCTHPPGKAGSLSFFLPTRPETVTEVSSLTDAHDALQRALTRSVG